MLMARVFLASGLLMILCAATDPASNAPNLNAKSSDPLQKVICEKHEVVGSRLATKRVCKTRAEWMQERLATRQEIDKQQTQRGISDHE